jgi:hypothetical protein
MAWMAALTAVMVVGKATPPAGRAGRGGPARLGGLDTAHPAGSPPRSPWTERHGYWDRVADWLLRREPLQRPARTPPEAAPAAAARDGAFLPLGGHLLLNDALDASGRGRLDVVR